MYTLSIIYCSIKLFSSLISAKIKICFMHFGKKRHYLMWRIQQKTLACIALFLLGSGAVWVKAASPMPHANAPVSEADQQVTGKVTNGTTGEGLPGVSVVIKGTRTGPSQMPTGITP